MSVSGRAARCRTALYLVRSGVAIHARMRLARQLLFICCIVRSLLFAHGYLPAFYIKQAVIDERRSLLPHPCSTFSWAIAVSSQGIAHRATIIYPNDAYPDVEALAESAELSLWYCGSTASDGILILANEEGISAANSLSVLIRSLTLTTL